MIKYSLGCLEGHEFESWFPDSAAYETQRKRGFVACPECGSTSVDKAIMAPAVVGGERSQPVAPSGALLDAKRREACEMLARLRQAIEANTVDVGTRFPELARAIHAGDEPERAIRGRASLEEARDLIAEGVGVLPIPALADELN